jgi:hypothetical protein
LRSRANGPSPKTPRPSPSRSRERCVLEERPEVSSIDREPSPRDALSSARLRPCAGAAVWPPRCRTSTTFGSSGSPRIRSSSTPVHAIRCQRSRASLGLGVARRFLQPITTRGHTRRATDLRTRVGLSPRCSPAPTDAGCVGPAMRRRIEGLRTTTCTRRLARAAFH